MRKLFYTVAFAAITLTIASCGDSKGSADASVDSAAIAASIAAAQKADSIARAEPDSNARADSIAKADTIAKAQEKAAASGKIDRKLNSLSASITEIRGGFGDPPMMAGSAAATFATSTIETYQALKKMESDMTDAQRARFKEMEQTLRRWTFI